MDVIKTNYVNKFVFEGNNVEIIIENDKPLFEIYSLGSALGHSVLAKGHKYPNKKRIEQSLENAEIQPVLRNAKLYITEEQLYDLMLEMKTDKVKPFRKWITHEVLPTIRKTGGYVANDELFVETYLPFADKAVKELFKLQLLTIRQLNEKLDITTKELTETKKELTIANDTIEENRPKVEFAEQVSKSADSIDISTFAKLLHDKNNNVGRNKFYKWLRQNKYLMSDKAHYNLPYQSWINQKILELKEIVYESSCGKQIVPKVYITGKGQLYIINKLRKEFPTVIQM